MEVMPADLLLDASRDGNPAALADNVMNRHDVRRVSGTKAIADNQVLLEQLFREVETPAKKVLARHGITKHSGLCRIRPTDSGRHAPHLRLVDVLKAHRFRP